MKIFGIGLSKTGTTSLANSLEILGYKTKDNLGVTRDDPADLSFIDADALDANDAFTDTPIPSFYRELDAKYPGSRFILTVRDIDGWLLSCKKQFTQKLADKQNEAHNRLFMELYNSTVFDEQKFRSGYKDFVEGVYQYFSERPDDLLVMNVSAGDGWETLCPFLEKTIPEVPFPRANVTKIRWMKIEDITGIAKQAGINALGIYRFMQGDRLFPGVRNAGLTRSLGFFLHKARHCIHKDQADALAKAMDVSLHTIYTGLRELNPQIPIISPQKWNMASFSERKNWNHFWLVDPLHGHTLSSNPDTTLCLSIALIEDRSPVVGVIHAPVMEITYYASAGKGACRVNGNRDPVLLDPVSEDRDTQTTSPDSSRPHDNHLHETSTASHLNTLAMCMLAENKPASPYSIEDTMEWHTAAAHVVLTESGTKIINCETHQPLTYNKEDFMNSCIIIK